MNARELILAEYHRRDGRRDMSYLAAGATAQDIARLLDDQEGNRGKGKLEHLKSRWIASDDFRPTILPVKMLHPVRIPSGRTKSFSTGPIVVELNFRNVEQTDAGEPNGFIPPYLIIDGQHRWAEAAANGQEYIHTLVGDKALPRINADLIRWTALTRRAAERYAAPLRKNGAGQLTLLGYQEPAPADCIRAGTVCEHCEHFRSHGTECELFRLLEISPRVKPDAYCRAYV